MLLKNILFLIRGIKVYHELLSDHRPVISILGNIEPLPPAIKSTINWTLLHNTFKANSPSVELEKIPQVIDSQSDVNLAIESLTSHIQHPKVNPSLSKASQLIW